MSSARKLTSIVTRKLGRCRPDRRLCRRCIHLADGRCRVQSPAGAGHPHSHSNLRASPAALAGRAHSPRRMRVPRAAALEPVEASRHQRNDERLPDAFPGQPSGERDCGGTMQAGGAGDGGCRGRARHLTDSEQAEDHKLDQAGRTRPVRAALCDGRVGLRS